MRGEVVAIDVTRWASRAAAAIAALARLLTRLLLGRRLVLALLGAGLGIGVDGRGNEPERREQGGATGAEQG